MDETSHRAWSKICSVMGTGFEMLKETSTTRICMISDWMEQNEKDRQELAKFNDSKLETKDKII